MGMTPNGFLQFEFSIGDPALAVELVLRLPAFREFCAANAVTFIGEADHGLSAPKETLGSLARSVGLRDSAQEMSGAS
jgi:hypothetical protein